MEKVFNLEKFQEQVIDYIVSTTDLNREEDEFYVDVTQLIDSTLIEVSINNDYFFDFYSDADPNVECRGEYSLQTINVISEIMKSDYEIWMMFSNCFEEVNECTINR